MMKIRQLCMLAVCCALLAGTAAGYTIAFTINPAETEAGNIVTVTGTSNVPAGYSDEAILYQQVPNFQPREIGRYTYVITEGGFWGFSIDTTGFLPATYKIQLPKSGDYPYGSSAILMRTFIINGPPETSVPVTTPPAHTPAVTATPDGVTTFSIPPASTTSPVGVETVGAAAVISALAFAYAGRRRNK